MKDKMDYKDMMNKELLAEAERLEQKHEDKKTAMLVKLGELERMENELLEFESKMEEVLAILSNRGIKIKRGN